MIRLPSDLEIAKSSETKSSFLATGPFVWIPDQAAGLKNRPPRLQALHTCCELLFAALKLLRS